MIAGVTVIACSGGKLDGRACAPGDNRYCDCASGKPGYQSCSESGDGYGLPIDAGNASDAAPAYVFGACDCSGAIPPGAGVLVDSGAADAPSDSSLAAFLDPCVNDSDCVTNLCFPFNAYGPHCSKKCTKDTDCPAPSPGCSGMGACKLH